MRIAVDLDGVCYEFQRTYRYMMREYLRVEMPPVDQFWHHWDAQMQYGEIADHKWMWAQGVERGLFRYGHMVTGARRGLEALYDMGHDLVIVTHRPANATPDTVDWLSLNLKGLPYSLHILSGGENKASVDWDVLIDDRPENIQAAQDCGRIGILFSQPWNENYDWIRAGARRATGWKETVDVVRSLGAR